MPPVLLKAIAWRESGWGQFWSDGRAKVSGDCGIGIMQITGGAWDYRRLAADYLYNVDAGAQVLRAKMNASSANVPRSLGADEQRVLENWYRAAYRYNGAGYAAERYADAVFSLVRTPPSGILPWAPPVAVTSPKAVLAGYRPTSGHGYVARLDGTWVSTLGSRRHPVLRADYLAYGARMSPGRGLESGQRAVAAYVARNVGWATWTGTRVSLGTYPAGRRSRIHDPAWVAPTRPVALRVTTPPGAWGRFDFRVRGGVVSSRLSAREDFAPLVDGTPISGGRAGGSWTLYPAQAPTARIVAAPRYVTDAAADHRAPLGLSFADPAPGAGVAYVEVFSRLACDGCGWVRRARVTAASVRVPLAASGRHEIRVRAVDRAWHVGPWSAVVPIVVPRDDTDPALVFDGEWSTEPVGDSWLGAVATAPAGAGVETAFTGTSYAVIGSRGPAYAPLSVYLDGTLVAVIDPTAGTTAERQVLYEGSAAPGEHVVRVVVAGEPPGEDGVAPEAGPRGRVDAIAAT